MRILALETSGRVGSVALLQADGPQAVLVAERELPADQRTARSLLPCVQQLLREQQWPPASIELVGVATGPGSFTGLRIGVVAAKTFAYATGAQLAGVHTLAAIAAGTNVRHGRLWTMLDAQRQELFVAAFDADRPLAEQRDPPTEILSVPEFLARLSSGDAIAGPPIVKLREQLPKDVIVAHESTWIPTAAAIGHLAARWLAAGATVDPLQLVPQYFRKSAAEEKAGI